MPLRAVAARANRLNYARYCRFIYTTGPHTMVKVLKWLYKGGSSSLFQFLDKHCGGLKDFDFPEKQKIRDGVDVSHMDATLLYKLLRKVCGLAKEDEAWHKKPLPGQDMTLEQALHKVKNVRNFFAHPDPENFISVSDNQLDEAMKNFQELFTKVLVLAGKKANLQQSVVEAAVAQMEEALREERDAESGVSVADFVRMCSQELLEQEALASRTSSYVQPRLLLEDQEGTSRTPEFPLRDLLSNTCSEGSRPELILVVGETGSGKSALCWYVQRTWLTEHQALHHLQEYQLVLYLHCSQVNTRDLHHLLRTCLLPLTSATVDGAELTRIFRKLKILWLVDGWEEATPEAKCLLQELLEKQSSSHSVLVASRPEMSAVLTGGSFPKKKFLKASILELNTYEKEELLKINMPDQSDHSNARVVEDFMSCIEGFNSDLQKDLSNPLKLKLAARLWCEDPSKLKAGVSLTELYMAIKDVLIKDLVAKRLAEASPSTQGGASHVINKWFRHFCKVAFEAMENGPLLKLDDKSVRRLKTVCDPATASHCLSTFLEFTPDREGLPYRGNYSFLHFTQQCFYAALYVDVTSAKAPQPDTKLNQIFKTSSDFVDPYLGIYDLVLEVLVLIMIIVSRLSLGWMFASKKRENFSGRFKQLLRKTVNLATRKHPKQLNVSNISNRLVYYPVFLQILEMRAVGRFTDKLSAKVLGNLIFASLEEDDNPAKWFEVLRSSKFKDDNLVQVVSEKISTASWVVTDGDLKAAWELMMHVVPKEVFIRIKRNPKTPIDLEVILFLIAKTKVKVHLHLQWHYGVFGVKEYSDEYLRPLCNDKSKCKLITFAGHLSDSSLQSLAKASHLQNLALRITNVSCLDLLSSVTQNIRRLETLDVVYDLKKFVIPASSLDGFFGFIKLIDGTLAILTLQGIKKLSIALYLPHLRDASVNTAVNLISKLSKKYETLYVGDLDHKGVKKLVSGLENNLVVVRNLIKPIYIKEIRNYVPFNFGSLPLQVPVKEFVEKWHDVTRTPPFPLQLNTS